CGRPGRCLGRGGRAVPRRRSRLTVRQRSPLATDLITMYPTHPHRDPIVLYQRALRVGDGELSLALGEALRRDPLLRPRADELLASLPRRPAPAGALGGTLVALGEALGRRGVAP
ncbi:MAG: hypothetical protein M3376_06875, partial [Actinomycetota bacterium]|nr:hypothetical protein [Actinomycetota bacterium]